MPRPEPEAPRMLGRYHLIEECDHDALGLLYLSRLEGPSGFQRWAVVRRLYPMLENDTALVDTFYEAARVAALVQHPNVAVVFDVGQREGPSWVAREYLHGETLADLLTQTIEGHAPVPWDLACRMVANAALGADTLHDLRPGEDPASSSSSSSRARAWPIGFLEGVVTPARTVVTYDGKTKLVEGCLPLRDGRPSLDAPALAYRAPELSDEDCAGARADVFALGVLLWELCAGKRLFGGGSEAETRARVEARAIPFLRASVRCPSMVDEVIRRALAREPDVRHPSCRVLARELEACLVSKGLNVTDDDIGRYMLGVFADRFEEREESLLSAANVTEVFDRGEIQARVAAAQVASQRRLPPPGDDDDIDNTETPDATTALARAPLSAAARGSGGYPPGGNGPETLPLNLVGRKKALQGGFDELPTARHTPRHILSSGNAHPPPESVVFVAADRELSDLASDSYPDLSPETVRTPALVFDDDGPTTARANEPPVQKPSSEAPSITSASGATQTRVFPMPVLPGKPPSLSAVLIAHERPRSSYFIPAVALALVAGVGVSTTLLFRHFASPDPASVASAAPNAGGSPDPVAPEGSPPDPVAPGGYPPDPRASASAVAAVPVPTATVTATATVTPVPTVAEAAPAAAPEPMPVRRGGSSRRATAPTGKAGLLTVICTPACDDVLDGGRSLGPSPVFKVSVPVGSHRITLIATDPPARKVVSVVVNEDDVAVVREAFGNP